MKRSFASALLLFILFSASCSRDVKTGHYFLDNYPSSEKAARDIIGRYVYLPGSWYERPLLKPDGRALVEISPKGKDIFNNTVIVEDFSGSSGMEELKQRPLRLNPETDILTRKLIEADIGLSLDDIKSLYFKIDGFYKKAVLKDLDSFNIELMCQKVTNEYGDNIFTGKPNPSFPDSIITGLFQVAGKYIYTFKKDATFVLNEAMFKNIEEIQHISETDSKGQQIVTTIGSWPVIAVQETKGFCSKYKGNFSKDNVEPDDLIESYTTEPYWP